MEKKDKKYQELDLQQNKLKSKLHENIRKYYKYAQDKARKKRVKVPVTMSELEKQEEKIKKCRKTGDRRHESRRNTFNM